MEREFPVAGDDTCCTSCLLRIKLLRGENLEPWQIFKALHSSIQKRGYGRIPWAEKEARRAGKSVEDIEKEEQKKDPDYVSAMNKWRDFKQSLPEAYHFPCYYDAWKMGLWNPTEPATLQPRITHAANSTRNIRFDRADVERETKQLANNAAKQLRELRDLFAKLERDGWKQTDPTTKHTKHFPVRAAPFGDFLCHGPAGVGYASYFAETREALELHLGSPDDWMGALGQKIPRFDNRILDDCILIPRFHVCKAEIRPNPKSGKPFPESLLPAEVTCLMKLKNTLVAEGSGQRKLRVEEIRKIFETLSADVANVKPDAKDWPKKVANCFAVTKADWARSKGIKELELRPLPGQEEIKPPKDTGRSGFCRPALRLLRELILSGKKPSEFHAEQLAKLGGNTAEKKGLVPADLKFLLDMGETWEGIYVPAQKLDALAARHTVDGKLDADAAVADLLSGINDPVVRHRLGVFAGRLRDFYKRFGLPVEVVLEFIREDFMGPKRKAKLLQFQRDREKARKTAREETRKAGAEEKSAALKYELCKEQGCLCLYCGQPFSLAKLEDYEREHIVPLKQGGPDAMVNYVLAHGECNKAKGEQTPFQWKHGKEGWDGYKKLVEKHATTLRNKKVQLLLREDAADLVERYTALAETAWVSKLAQTIVNLRFGWKNGVDYSGSQPVKRVIVVSGGLTARVRRKYSLDKLLYTGATDPEVLAKKVKNRDDKRHHALDAMVLTFIPQWAGDPGKEGFFRFPGEFRDATGREDYEAIRRLFDQQISQVMPQHLAYERPALADTLYGMRESDGAKVIVQKCLLRDLAYKQVQKKKVFELEYAIDQAKALRDKWIREELLCRLAQRPDEAEWNRFCDEFVQRRKDGSPGARILKVALDRDEDPAEFKDLSKDGRGAYRTKKKVHRGQFVFLDAKGSPRVRAVRVFESPAKVKAEIEDMGQGIRTLGFFQSMCLVELKQPVTHGKITLQPGTFQLNTIKKDGRAQLTNALGVKSPEIGLAKLVPAGFARKD